MNPMISQLEALKGSHRDEFFNMGIDETIEVVRNAPHECEYKKALDTAHKVFGAECDKMKPIDLSRLDMVMEALEMATDCYNDAKLVDKAKCAIAAIKQVLTKGER